MASLLQPLDVYINKPFKDRVRFLYNDWMQECDHAFIVPEACIAVAACRVDFGSMAQGSEQWSCVHSRDVLCQTRYGKKTATKKLAVGEISNKCRNVSKIFFSYQKLLLLS